MTRVSRRRFVQGAGVAGLGLLVGCGKLLAQPPPPTAASRYQVGYLDGSTPATQVKRVALFRQALADLGYMEGRDLAIEYGWGEGDRARLAARATELGHLPVSVIVVRSTELAQIARESAPTVSIILAGAGDPVAAGLAASYARPGGTVTGITSLAPEETLLGKRLQLLKELAPTVSRVGVFWDARDNPFPGELWHRYVEAVGVELHPLEVRSADDIDGAFEAAAREGVDALTRGPGALAQAHRPRIIQHATRLRWPTIFYQREWAEEGALIVYAASEAEIQRRAAYYVDRILKGHRPAELPIEQPTTFDFIVNLRTAQMLGLTIPPHVLLQATEVIQ